MPIPRIYSPDRLAAGIDVALSASAVQHVVKALRLRPGAALVLFDGQGGEYSAQLLTAGNNARVRVLEHHAIERESPFNFTLVQAISKSDRMDYTVQKSTELGVNAIIPVSVERSVVKLDKSRAEKKRVHWQAVAIAACEQCGRNRIPEVAPLRRLEEYLATIGDDMRDGLRVVLDPEANRHLGALAEHPGRITAMIGPEGGLTERELLLLHQAGFQGVRLGPRILRTETAGVALLGAMQALWGDFD